MRIGIDIDGVLADFNSSFIQTVIAVTGEDKFPPRPFDIPTWHYPQYFGYSEEVMDYKKGPVWAAIFENPSFWSSLIAYPKVPLFLLILASDTVHDFYFITNRDGIQVKNQTERWLNAKGFPRPTVLISGAKGLCAQALKLDVYVDDRWENCLDVKEKSPSTRVFILDRPWNRLGDDTEQKLERISFVGEILPPLISVPQPI